MNAKRAINMRLMTKFLQGSQTGDNAVGCHNFFWPQRVCASEIGKLTSPRATRCVHVTGKRFPVACTIKATVAIMIRWWYHIKITPHT